MQNRLNTTRPILLVLGMLASGSGCHVLNIPSYRADSQCGLPGHFAADYNYVHCEFCEPDSAGYATDGVYPPGLLHSMGGMMHCGLPVPTWYAEWKAKRDLPEPAPYPRFHPLPTRPMFQSRPVSAEDPWNASSLAPAPYGQIPAAETGNAAW
ncbi:MAG: hypothetical protein ABI557_19445, partial [Aureliella sp.]